MPNPPWIESPRLRSWLVAVVMVVLFAGTMAAAWGLTIRPGATGATQTSLWVEGLRVHLPEDWAAVDQTAVRTVFQSPTGGASLVVARVQTQEPTDLASAVEWVLPRVMGRPTQTTGREQTAFPGADPPRVELKWAQLAGGAAADAADAGGQVVAVWKLEALAVIAASPTRFHVVILTEVVGERESPQRAYSELSVKLRRAYLGQDGRVELQP